MSQRKLDRIRRLYDQTTAATIERDLERAVEILKSLPDEDTRLRAAVFMDGLSQMRSEWRLERQRKSKKRRVPASKPTDPKRRR